MADSKLDARIVERVAATLAAWKENPTKRAALFSSLKTTWEGLGQSHHHGPALVALADALIAMTTEAWEIEQLPYAIGNWCSSWREVGRHAIAACDQIASTTLARDRENDAALWLYAQDDFLAKTKRKGPPIAPPPVEDQVAKIKRIVQLFEEDVVHPLDIPSLETIPITSGPVLDALLHALATTTSFRARNRVIDALGRTRMDVDRAVAALAKELTACDSMAADAVGMAIHYNLKKKGVSAIDALMKRARVVIDDLSEKDTSDYRHVWPLTAFVTLLPHAKGEAGERARMFAEELLAEIETMPDWKRTRFHDFCEEAPAALGKVRDTG